MYPSFTVWSATMEPLRGLRQSTSATILLREMRSQGSARVMALGMGAYYHVQVLCTLPSTSKAIPVADVNCSHFPHAVSLWRDTKIHEKRNLVY